MLLLGDLVMEIKKWPMEIKKKCSTWMSRRMVDSRIVRFGRTWRTGKMYLREKRHGSDPPYGAIICLSPPGKSAKSTLHTDAPGAAFLL